VLGIETAGERPITDEGWFDDAGQSHDHAPGTDPPVEEESGAVSTWWR
jgi:hypothetical protein